MAVAVVSYQTREVLEPCLESVAAARPVETVVVDNGSTDGSVEMVRARFPDVTLVQTERNLGYGGAANRGIATCTAPVVLLLNSDTIVAPDALQALDRHLAQHPAAAVIGPRLTDLEGTLQPSTFSFPSAGDLLIGETGLHLLLRRIPGVRNRLLRTWAHDAERPVPWVIGAALAIRRQPFELVDGFDESFFMYWEEVDLCRRLGNAGFEVRFAPVTTVQHVRSVSTRKQPDAMRRQWLVSFRTYLVKHESRRDAAQVLWLLRSIVRARVGRDAARLPWISDDERRQRLAASIAGWRGLLAERSLWRP